MPKTFKLGKRFSDSDGCLKNYEKRPKLSKVNIQSLPVEIMTNIFEQMDFETRILAEGVCVKWRHIIQKYSWRNTTFFNFRLAGYSPYINCEEVDKKLVEKSKREFSAIANRCAPHLRKVELHGTSYRQSFTYCWDMLLRQIPANQLQHLEVLEYRLDHAQLGQIADRFKTLKSIRIDMNEANTTLLNGFFKTCNLLENLVLDLCNLRNVSFKNVARTLKNLEMCDFYNINNDQLAQIGDRCPQLEFLLLKGAINDCNLNLLLSKLKNLKKVDIHLNMSMQLPSFAHMKQLSYLKIRPAKWFSDHLFESIGQISQLKCLFLIGEAHTKPEDDREKYSENGLVYLANLQKLEHLQLENIRLLTDSNLEAIAESNPSLKKLSIHACPLITDDFIINVLDSCCELNQLDVSHCRGVTNRTLEAIVQKLVAKHGNRLPTDNEPRESFF